jgi:hypothetical protein
VPAAAVARLGVTGAVVLAVCVRIGLQTHPPKLKCSAYFRGIADFGLRWQRRSDLQRLVDRCSSGGHRPVRLIDPVREEGGVNKHVEEEALLASILEELAASGDDKQQCEAKAIFRLLNYFPPEEQPLNQKRVAGAKNKKGEDN